MFCSKHDTHIVIVFKSVFSRFRIPFNWRTPAGYFFVMITQCLISYYITAVVFCSFFIFFEMCVYLVALTNDVEYNLNDLAHKIKQFAKQKERQSQTAKQIIKHWNETRQLQAAYHMFIECHWNLMQ